MASTEADQTITCMDCKQAFVFTVNEQAFFAKQGFTTPKRCKPCRDVRKAEKAEREGGGGGGHQPAPQQAYAAPWQDESRDRRGGKKKHARGGRR